MIWIFDEKLRKIKPLKQFEMAQWSNKFRDIGTFTINARYVEENLYLLDKTKTYYVMLYTGDDETKTDLQNTYNNVFGKIEKVSKEDEQDADFPSTIKVEGRLILMLLTKRVIKGTVNFTDIDVISYVTDLIRLCFNGKDNKERYVKMNVEGHMMGSLYKSTYLTKQVTGGQLWDEIKDYLEQYKLGIRFVPRIVETYELSENENYNGVISGLSNIDGFEVLVTTGIDRRKGYTTKPVIFSKSLSNVKRASYSYNAENDMNVAYVAGEGEQEQRKWYEIQKDSENKKGAWCREELWVDARDIQSQIDEGTTLTTEEYEALIKQRANEKFEENTISDEYSSTLNEYSKKFVYMKDYDLGDWVTIVDHDLDIEIDAQIVEVTTTLQNNETINDITFEYGKANKTEVKDLKQIQTNIQNIENNIKYLDNKSNEIDEKNKYVLENNYYILPGGLKICWGTVTVTYANSNVLEKSVSFPVTFINAPFVTAFITNTDNSYADLFFNLKTSGVSKTGFTLFLHSTQGGFDSSSVKVCNWIAVGY